MQLIITVPLSRTAVNHELKKVNNCQLYLYTFAKMCVRIESGDLGLNSAIMKVYGGFGHENRVTYRRR